MIGSLETVNYRTRMLQRVYRAMLLILVGYMAIAVTLGVVKMYQVSQQVQSQTTFIINYLRCIGQTPTQARGPGATNSCFERYAPTDISQSTKH